MTKSARRINIEYYAVQALYWAGYCASGGYAAVYLQGLGYSNSQLGLIMALGNILGLTLSTLLASLVDRTGRKGLFACVMMLLLTQLALVVSFMGCTGPSISLSLGYSLYIACVVCVNPLNTQLCFTLQEQYGHINYGAARSMGSAAFAPTSILLGTLVEGRGVKVLLYGSLLFFLMQAALLLTLYMQSRASAGNTPERVESAPSSSIVRFFAENGSFCLLLVGMAVMFFPYNLAGSFLINLVRHAGGDASNLGTLSAFSALLELPAMIFYDRLCRRIKCLSLLCFSALMFVAKSMVFALFGSIPGLYAACALQSVSYALITPATVHYVNLYIPHKDAAKGQALARGAMTLGTVFSYSIGGVMYDRLSVPAVLLIGTVVAALGAAVCIAACRRTKQSLA